MNSPSNSQPSPVASAVMLLGIGAMMGGILGHMYPGVQASDKAKATASLKGIGAGMSLGALATWIAWGGK